MTLTDLHMRVQRFQFTPFDTAPAAPKPAAAVTPVAPQQTQEQIPSAVTEETPVPPPAPSFSEQEMSLAKMASYQEGVIAGQKEAEEKRNKEAEQEAASLRSLQELIANRITLASEDHKQAFKKQQDTVNKLTLAIARKVAGDAMKREPYASVEALLKECLSLIMGNDSVTLAVAASKADGLRQSLGALKQHLHDFQGGIVIESDPALAENDCRVEWGNGRAVRSTENLWAEIDALIKKTPITSI